MVAGIIALLAFAIFGNAIATPTQRDEAEKRWDKIGKIAFSIALVMVAVWIWYG